MDTQAGITRCSSSTNTMSSASSNFGLKRCKKVMMPQDRISDLPYELVSQILSRLTLKEAVATSILSKRWISNWKSYPNLIFGFNQLFDDMKYHVYVNTVNNVLRQHNGFGLCDFRLFYHLRSNSTNHINNWIDFAISSRVSRLELIFQEVDNNITKNLYNLPPDVFQSGYKENPLLNYGMSLPTTSFGDRLESLTHLYLKYVNVSDEVFGIILSTCSSLENLRLYGGCSLVHAKHPSPHPKLKSFEICIPLSLETLQLVAPNLESFTYEGRKRNIYIKDSPHLVNLDICYDYPSNDPKLSLVYPQGKNFFFDQFATCVSRLECLVIGVHLFAGRMSVAEFSIFSNLKQLALDVFEKEFVAQSYLVAALMMNAAPFLHELELNLPLSYRGSKQELGLHLPRMSPHMNLKEVRLSSFRGFSNTMKFLNYVLDHAVAIEMILITTSLVNRIDNQLWFNSVKDTEHAPNLKKCRKCVSKLRERLLPHSRLIYLDECDREFKRVGFPSFGSLNGNAGCDLEKCGKTCRILSRTVLD